MEWYFSITYWGNAATIEQRAAQGAHFGSSWGQADANLKHERGAFLL
jgi:hypothetical protein